jgi:hypothetical protein
MIINSMADVQICVVCEALAPLMDCFRTQVIKGLKIYQEIIKKCITIEIALA